MNRSLNNKTILEKFLGHLSSCERVSEFELHPSSDGIFRLYNVTIDIDGKSIFVCLFSAGSINPTLAYASYQYSGPVEAIEGNFDCWVEGIYHTDGQLMSYKWPHKRVSNASTYIQGENQYGEIVYYRLYLLDK